MAAMTKRMKPWAEKMPPGKQYPIDEALALVKEFADAKFGEAVDVCREPRHRCEEVGPAGPRFDRAAPRHRQERRGWRYSPQGKNAEAALEAGADIVGLEDLAEKVKAGEINFDVVVASPDAMRVVGQLGQILGPRGLMPNPKVGTVTPDVAGAVRNAKAGQVRLSCRQGWRRCIARSARPTSSVQALHGEPACPACRPQEDQAGDVRRACISSA